MIKSVSIKNTPRIYGAIVERLKASPQRAAADAHDLSHEWEPQLDTNFLVTSASRKEGRTTTAIGLAMATAIAKPQQRVLLVDLDQRHPGIPRLIRSKRLRSAPGITDVIQGKVELSKAVQPTHLENLNVLPIGTGTLNVPEDCQSEGLRQALLNIRSQYDYAFFDSPALSEHVEGRLLSEAMDGVVLVVRSDRSHKDDVVSARQQLPAEKLVGAIVNDCRYPVPAFISRSL